MAIEPAVNAVWTTNPSASERGHGPPGPDPVLCIGAISRNSVEAAIELAHETGREIMLIASRRQVDRAPDRGYVEGWSTRDFVTRVRRRDPDRVVALGRDHGGPWQHPREVSRGFDEGAAMRSAFASLKDDIDAGLDYLHLDTSVESDREASLEAAISRLLELYRRCFEHASRSDRGIQFEIGFERQRREVGDIAEFRAATKYVLEELDHAGLPRPKYVVAQTGTRVVETRNDGVISSCRSGDPHDAVTSRLEGLTEICRELGVLLKAHNCDYLPPSAWRVLGQTGIGGANVAPEYGVAETRALLRMLGRAGMDWAIDCFVELADGSGMWRKWMAPGSGASREDRAVIAGHYVYFTPAVKDMRAALCARLGLDPPGLDGLLKGSVKRVMRDHLEYFKRDGGAGERNE